MSQGSVSTSIAEGHSYPPFLCNGGFNRSHTRCYHIGLLRALLEVSRLTGGLQVRCLLLSPTCPQSPTHSPHAPQSFHEKFTVLGPAKDWESVHVMGAKVHKHLPGMHQSSPTHQSNLHLRPGRQSLSQSQSPSPCPQSPLQFLSPGKLPTLSLAGFSSCLAARSIFNINPEKLAM